MKEGNLNLLPSLTVYSRTDYCDDLRPWLLSLVEPPYPDINSSNITRILNNPGARACLASGHSFSK